MIPYKGFPTRHARWCCDKLKKDPTKNVPLKHRLMGLRAEESPKRAKRPIIENVGYLKQIVYKPIFHWLEWEIWEFIDKYELPYCTLYDEGFSRLGCVVCPFLCGEDAGHQKRLQIHKSRWPAIYTAFEKAMRKLWDNKERHRQLRHNYSATFDEFMINWYAANPSKKAEPDIKMKRLSTDTQKRRLIL